MDKVFGVMLAHEGGFWHQAWHGEVRAIMCSRRAGQLAEGKDIVPDEGEQA